MSRDVPCEGKLVFRRWIWGIAVRLKGRGFILFLFGLGVAEWRDLSCSLLLFFSLGFAFGAFGFLAIELDRDGTAIARGVRDADAGDDGLAILSASKVEGAIFVVIDDFEDDGLPTGLKVVNLGHDKRKLS